MKALLTKVFVVLFVLFVLFLLDSNKDGYSQVWTTNEIPGVSRVDSIAFSADGTKIFAGASFTNTIFISTNSGVTWSSTGAALHIGSGYWAGIASSADGTHLIAAADVGGVYTSTDGGANWFSNAVPVASRWDFVAITPDGTRMMAAAGYNSTGPICISTNSGSTWTQTGAPIGQWASVATSADGSVLLAGTLGGTAYVSTDSGTTWTPQTNLPAGRWTFAAETPDGNTLIAAAYQIGSGFGQVYISTNLGNLWTPTSQPTNMYLAAFCASADGSKLTAVGYASIFHSVDLGNTWSSNSVPESAAKWTGMNCSADGNKLALVGGHKADIYLAWSPPRPQLNLELRDNKPVISWLVSATNLVLQQSADLISWSSTTDAPALNLTNLNNELSLSPTNSSGFFRLISQ
jgi:photosystem II stability/assembly factor-like uncharacterized protein